MGNRRNPRYLEVLIAALAGGSSLVRGHSAWALGRIGSPEAVTALRARLGSEADAAVRGALQAALEDTL
jgi:epoxyqueuosine reductase